MMRCPRSRRCNAVRPARAGFTLVELMVAMLIFTIGILALASTAGVVVRQMGDSGRMSVAASVAKSRVERLRLAPCAVAVTDSAKTRGVSEVWRLTPMTRSSQIDVTITYTTKRGSRSQSYRSMVPCV